VASNPVTIRIGDSLPADEADTNPPAEVVLELKDGQEVTVRVTDKADYSAYWALAELAQAVRAWRPLYNPPPPTSGEHDRRIQSLDTALELAEQLLKSRRPSYTP
jgi:hypothetical protein